MKWFGYIHVGARRAHADARQLATAGTLVRHDIAPRQKPYAGSTVTGVPRETRAYR